MKKKKTDMEAQEEENITIVTWMFNRIGLTHVFKALNKKLEEISKTDPYLEKSKVINHLKRAEKAYHNRYDRGLK